MIVWLSQLEQSTVHIIDRFEVNCHRLNCKKSKKKNGKKDNGPRPKLRKKVHNAAPTSPDTMSKVWETVKKMWLASEKAPGLQKVHMRPTSQKVSKELGIDLEKACDATKNLADKGYLTFRHPYKQKRALYCKQRIIPKDLKAKYEES